MTPSDGVRRRRPVRSLVAAWRTAGPSVRSQRGPQPPDAPQPGPRRPPGRSSDSAAPGQAPTVSSGGQPGKRSRTPLPRVPRRGAKTSAIPRYNQAAWVRSLSTRPARSEPPGFSALRARSFQHGRFAPVSSGGAIPIPAAIGRGRNRSSSRSTCVATGRATAPLRGLGHWPCARLGMRGLRPVPAKVAPVDLKQPQLRACRTFPKPGSCSTTFSTLLGPPGRQVAGPRHIRAGGGNRADGAGHSWVGDRSRAASSTGRHAMRFAIGGQRVHQRCRKKGKAARRDRSPYTLTTWNMAPTRSKLQARLRSSRAIAVVTLDRPCWRWRRPWRERSGPRLPLRHSDRGGRG